MSLLFEWLENGWLCLFAIAIIWAEIAIVCLRSRAPTTRLRALVPNALSGTLLLGALALALRDAPLIWVALLLAASLPVHVADVLQRLSEPRPGSGSRIEPPNGLVQEPRSRNPGEVGNEQ